MKRLTLQWRITILTALVLLICTATLTAISIRNAEPLYSLASDQPETDVIENYESYGSLDPVELTPVPAQLAKKEFDGKSILYCGLFTVLGTVAVYIVTGHALQPLRRLTDKVDTVDEHNLSMRLPEVASNDEVSRLTDGFNRMLSRLDDAFLRQKRFTANAAHELKTPLATLKTGIQVLDTDVNATLVDYQEQNQMTLESTDRLTNIVDDLLVLASAGETGGEIQETVLLEPLFDAICSELESRLEQRRMTCHVDCGDLSVIGNPAFFLSGIFQSF
ncbi:MAG: histidine kinase dimerization/phospho-acceptor domain-containing protein [Eubacteriales bacterium]|nr:histidine kinase dimerization/phospho-acceptor domain-containing protein [Eubacteriales bacterium]